MNFDFNDEQKFMKEEARRFLAARAPLSLVHDVLDDPAANHDNALWREIVEQGWAGLVIPEEYGGLGASAIELCAVAEELGRAAASIPFSSTVYLFAQALLLAGTDAQKARYLPDIAGGALRGCLAVSEAPGQPVTASGNSLTGEKLPVVDGERADYALVSADEDGQVSLFIVSLTGSKRAPVTALDPTRPIARIRFDNATGERLGAMGEGAAILRKLYDMAAVPFAFEQLGGAERCLEMARDFSLERYAFGRPIGGYQAIKHKLADLYIQNQLARSNCYFGAWALSAGAPELASAAAAARLSAGDAFWLAAKESLHVHGGMGFTWESDCQIFYRRAQHLALVLGSAKSWKERLVGEVIRLRAA